MKNIGQDIGKTCKTYLLVNVIVWLSTLLEQYVPLGLKEEL